MADQDQATKDAVIKQRIIKHMNSDHQISLSYYLRHYRKLSSSEARNPNLDDITFQTMVVRTRAGKTYTVPFNPLMKSWAEARTRTVDMDRESREALDISSIRITEYEPPKTFMHHAIIGAILLAVVCYATKGWVVPGTFVYDSVLAWFPGGPEAYLWVTKAIMVPTLVIHTVEAVMLDRIQLRKYGVERGSLLWCKWMINGFIEGYGCFQRINATVKRKMIEAQKAKH